MAALPNLTEGSDNTVFPNAEGLKSKRLALGCMQLGGEWDPDVPVTSEEKARAQGAVETALELGWDFFDHADIYAMGKSEKVFGELIREMGVDRESIIVQSKCGIVFADQPNPGDPKRFDYSKKHIIKSTEDSLKRLDMDYLDSLLLHRPDLLAEPEEIISAFAELKSAGKVRHFGVSNFTPHLLNLYQSAGFTPIANQLEINMLRTALIDCSMIEDDRLPMAGHPGDGTLEWNRMHGVVTQAWAPMAYGYLSGREPDWEKERVNKAASEVQRIARNHGVPAEAVVIGWLLRHPAAIQPIIGSRDPVRLRACNQALNLQLSRMDWYALYSATRISELP